MREPDALPSARMSRRGDRIESTGMPGMAAKQTAHAEQESRPCTV